MKQIMRNLKRALASVIEKRNTRKVFLADADFNTKYSLSNGTHPDNQLARIMLLMHALEKGMTFKGGRIFGEDKAKALSKEIKAYIEKHSINDTCIVALNILKEYLANEHSTRNDQVRKDIDNLLQEYSSQIREGYAGTKYVTEPPLFDKDKIEEFFASRSSVREYSNEDITNEEIASAIRLASYTPSACNRQASRVHVYNSPKLMERLISNQLGNQNWCQNAKALFVVTVNECYFGGVRTSASLHRWRFVCNEPRAWATFKSCGNML